MDITLGFWEKGNAKLSRSYVIKTETSVAVFEDKFVARIAPADSNFPPDQPFAPVFGSSAIDAKDKAVAEIRARKQNVGLRSFEKKP